MEGVMIGFGHVAFTASAIEYSLGFFFHHGNKKLLLQSGWFVAGSKKVSIRWDFHPCKKTGLGRKQKID